jgi:hypothetical protein
MLYGFCKRVTVVCVLMRIERCTRIREIVHKRREMKCRDFAAR